MILYFSGTGNSAFAAKRIQKRTGDQILDICGRIRSRDYSGLHSDTPWVVVCPTYAWQIPRIVRDWLIRTDLSGSDGMYFVMTCGGGIGDASNGCRNLCVKKGKRFMGTGAVVMPENYIAMFPTPGAEEAAAIIDAALPEIDRLADHIAGGEKIGRPSNLIEKIESSIVNPFFYAFCIKDQKFRAGDKCIGCGMCAKVCPLSNIVMEQNRPVWKGNCTHCMACISRCPAEAIEYGKGSAGKPRYVCPDRE